MRKMQHETVRRILLIAYGICTLLLVVPYCVAIDLIPNQPLTEIWVVLLELAILYLPHQICAHLHMRESYREISFQGICLVIDLIAVTGYAFAATRMGENAVFAAWCMVYVVAQRAVILLRMLKKMPDWW